MSTSIHTVFFDVGGTILRVYPSVGEIYAAAVGRLGHRVDPSDISANFKSAWSRSLERRRLLAYACDDATLRAEWFQVVLDCFADLVPRPAVEEVFASLYEHFCLPDAWRIADGAIETFKALRGLGMRLGIISNWDSRLEATLRHVGVLDYFEHLVISYKVGVEKPHPRIFQEAIRAAGVHPRQILHIGDSYEWDILPAHSLGLNVLWIDPAPTPGGGGSSLSGGSLSGDSVTEGSFSGGGLSGGGLSGGGGVEPVHDSAFAPVTGPLREASEPAPERRERAGKVASFRHVVPWILERSTTTDGYTAFGDVSINHEGPPSSRKK